MNTRYLLNIIHRYEVEKMGDYVVTIQGERDAVQAKPIKSFVSGIGRPHICIPKLQGFDTSAPLPRPGAVAGMRPPRPPSPGTDQ